MGEPNHLRRVALLWLIASAIATPLVVVLLGPNMPPGNLSSEASGQVVTNMVMLGMVTPVVLLVLIYFGYAIIVFRAREGEPDEGPAVRGHGGAQIAWMVTTSAMVLFLAGFGTYELLKDGSGGGQGPNPIADPPGNALQVQVIAQQWEFTYRFPAYGGVETPHLELPVGQLVEFHVTSLDVTHSFWAYELGVKADANQGVDNIAYVTPKRIGRFSIRCAELCGLWHGFMFDTGQVVSTSAFASWIHQQQAAFAPITSKLPPYSKTYFPQPQRRGG
jgi:cytochrome c oxidase subunit II